MRTSPPVRLLTIVYATSALALAALVLAEALVPLALSGRLALEALGLGLAVLVARRFPVHLTAKTKTTVVTVPQVAAALLLPAPLALLVIAAGSLGAEAWRRTRYFQALFNSSVAVLQTGIATAMFAGLVGRGSLGALAPGQWLVPALLAALALYLLGLLLVEGIVSVQLGRLVLGRFWERTWLSLPQEALLSLLGLLLALVLVQAPWAVIFFPAPAWLVYRSLRTLAQGLAPTAGSTPAPAHLAQLPRRLQLYIVVTGAGAAVSGLAALLMAPPAGTAHSLLLSGLIVALATLAFRLPVKPAPKRVIVLDGALIMAAILVLSAGGVFAVAALATALGNAGQRRPWFNTLFNVAQQAGAALAATAVYHALTPVPLNTKPSPQAVAAAAAAAGVFWLVSCLLVDGITALQLRRSPLRGWLGAHRQSLLANAILLPLGIAVVPALDAAPWLVGVVLVPALLVRVLLRTALQLDGQTALLVADLLAGVAAAHPELPGRAERFGNLAQALAAAYGLPPAACRRVDLAARLALAADTLLPAAREDLSGEDAWALRSLRTLLEAPAITEALAYRRTNYDGSSAAAGPRGAGIPLTARMLALCEAWLALTGASPGLVLTDGLARLLAGAGKAWDPELVGLLARIVRPAPGGARAAAA